MKNKPYYQAMVEQVVAGGYTAAQVADATPAQIAAASPVDSVLRTLPTSTFFASAKAAILAKIKRAVDTTFASTIKTRITADLAAAGFADAEVERKTVQGRRCVLIWLDGKPEVIIDA